MAKNVYFYKLNTIEAKNKIPSEKKVQKYISELRLSRVVKATPRVNQETFDETNFFIELCSPKASFWCINVPHTLQSVTDLEHPTEAPKNMKFLYFS